MDEAEVANAMLQEMFAEVHAELTAELDLTDWGDIFTLS